MTHHRKDWKGDYHVTLRCKECKSYCSLYTGTIFSTSSKNIVDLMEMAKCWALNLTIEKTVELLKMSNTDSSRQTVGKFFRQLRNVCSLDLGKPNLILDGFGKPVEIDKSLFAKVKHGVGKDLFRTQVWVFGLAERETSKVYFHIVPDRTALT